MANQVTKIYELKTLGYDETIRQLTSIETSFVNISKLKKALNDQKYTTTDADDLAKVNQALEEARLKSAQLKLEKVQLANAAIALKNAQVANTNATKAQTAANIVEAGSYTDLLAKQKELYALLKNVAPGSSVRFQGQTINYDQAINEYKRLASAEQSFRRQFQADAVLIGEYTSGIVNAFKQMGLGDLVGGQVGKATARLKELDAEFEILKTELQSVKGAGGNFDTIEQKLVANRNEASKLNVQLNQLKTNLAGVGTVGNQITTGLANGFANLKGQVSNLLLTYTGFYAAFRATQDAVKLNSDLSDSFADLQIRVHGSAKDVQDLFEQIKKLDTRTSLTSLVDIANIVAKKGVGKDEIVPLTKSLDDLFVVLKKEIGEPSEATSSIIKLISIFNKDGKVTADRVNEIGTSIFKLTTSGVSTGKFLIDFAERVGAVRGITGLTLPNILGMGAALEQLGQHVEVAGTASIQLTTKLFSNVPKFAAAAKISVEEFRKLLKDNPFDALVATAQGLANLSDSELATNFEEVVTAFGEVNVTGARIKAVLGEIATNGELVKAKMKAAAVTTEDYGNAIEGSQLKQRTFAATLDKIKKQFETFASGESFTFLLETVAGLILLVLNNFTLFIPVFLVFIGLTNTATGSLIRLTTAWVLERAANALAMAQMVASNFVLAIYTSLISRAAVSTGVMAVAVRLLAGAFAFITSPIGIVLGIVAALVTVVGIFSSRAKDASDRIGILTQKQKFLAEATKTANDQLSESIAKEKVYIGILQDRNLHESVRQKALENLKTLMGEYGKALTLENVLTAEGTEALRLYNEQLLKKGKATALAAIQERENQKLTKLIQLQFDLSAAKQSGGIDLADVNENLREAGVSNVNIGQERRRKLSRSVTDFKYTDDEVQVLIDIVGEQINDQLNKTKAAAELNIKTEIEAITNTAAEKPIKVFEIDIPNLEKQLDEANKAIKAFTGSQSELNKLLKQRDDIQTKLDNLLNKNQKKSAVYRGARIPGEEKDELSEIDAKTKQLLAAEETRFARLQVITKDGQEKLHKVTYLEELAYIKTVDNINEQGLRNKIDLLERKKNLNARELDLLATFKEAQAKLELKYIKDIKALNESTFKEESDNFKRRLDAQIALIEEADQNVQINPDISFEDKAKNKKQVDDKIIELTKGYYVTLDALAKKYSISEIDIEAEKQKALSKLIKEGLSDELKITEAIYKDILAAHERYSSEIKAQYARRKLKVIESDKSNPTKKAELDKLDQEEENLLLNAEVGAAKVKLDQIKRDVAVGKATIKELEDAETAYIEAVRKLRDNIENKPLTLDKIKEGAKGLGEAIAKEFGLSGDAAYLVAEAFQVAEEAMNNFYDAERARIQKSLETQKTRLDIELQQRKDRAQSQAEQNSLEKEYAAKKLELEKKAFEKTKKLQLAQLAINYAVQLSNIAVAASANPLNPFTFGAAGIAQYVIQAAIATAAYFLQRQQIKGQEFAFGGNPDMSTTRGGKVKGRSHSNGGNPFIFKGRVFEDEVGELNIIRTKNVREDIVHTITGTHGQIASKLNVLGGGVEFNPGARTFADGGVLGSGYTAPSYTPSSSYSSGQQDMASAVLILAKEMSDRIDRIEVIQDTNTVTRAQKKIVKQEQIGVI